MRQSIVIQYRIDNWGSEADLEKRHQLEDLLDQALHATNNGECDGGDIGSGTMNIFLEEIVNVDRALTTVLEALRNAQALDGAVVAACTLSEKDEEDGANDGYTVLRPPDYLGEFNVLGL